MTVRGWEGKDRGDGGRSTLELLFMQLNVNVDSVNPQEARA